MSAVYGEALTPLPAVQPTLQLLVHAATAIFVSSEFNDTVPYTVFISWETSNDHPVQQFPQLIDQVLRSLEKEHIVVRIIYHNSVETVRPRTTNVFFVDGLSAFEELHATIRPKQYDFTGNYIIIVLNENEQAEEEFVAERILQLMWQYYVVNVDVLFGSLDYEEVRMYTYFPFNPGSCENVKSVTWNTFREGRFLTSRPHFPPKLNNFYGCPLTAAVYTYGAFMRLQHGPGETVVGMDGIDAVLLRHISAKLNFSTVLREVPHGLRFGLIFENGTTTGAMKMVIEGEANFTLGFFGYNQLRLKFMSLSHNYHFTALVVMVSAGEEYEAFEKLLLPFTNTLWFVFLGCISVGFLVISVISRMGTRMQAFVFGSRIQSPAVNLLNVLFGGSLSVLPTRNFARFLLTLWLIHGLITRTVYQQALFNFLQLSTNHSTITTLKQLIDGRYPIYLISSEEYVFNHLPELQPQVRIIPDAEIKHYDDAIRRGQLRGERISNYEKVLYDNARFADGQYLRMLKERLYNYAISIGLRLNSCLTKPFDDTLLELIPHGMVRAWVNRYVDDKYAVVPEASDERKQLTVRQLLGAFQLWAIALGGSCVVFFMEICCYYLAKKC
ncbi:AAEL014687-PA [Aedes aegypti]|uniref:AAEL014687-PA n=1 Tax=Aedes aegypti TaxID=7159 RepID=Q16FP2_AEDAE|nr:AAEL014687-PA [Aedes aegypti]